MNKKESKPKYETKFCNYCNRRLKLNRYWHYVNGEVYCNLEEASHAFALLQYNEKKNYKVFNTA